MRAVVAALVYGLLGKIEIVAAQQLDPIINMCVRFDHQCRYTLLGCNDHKSELNCLQPPSKMIHCILMVGAKRSSMLTVMVAMVAIPTRLAR